MHADDQTDRLGETARTINGFRDHAETAGPLGFRIYMSSFFNAYYARRGPEDGDYVVHFYPPVAVRFSPYASIPETATWRAADDGQPLSPTEQRWTGSPYWSQWFPLELDATAQEYFSATAPQLSALYVEELTSWCFTARGLALCLLPEDRMRGFLDRLDQAMGRHASELQSVFVTN